MRNTPCNKIKYRTELDAKIAIYQTQRNQASCREERGYYWCAEHRAYHLTKKKGLKRVSETNEQHEQNMKQMDEAIKDARERGDKDMETKLIAVKVVVAKGTRKK